MKTKTIFFSEHAYNVLAFCIIDCKKGCVFVYVYIKYFCAASKLQYIQQVSHGLWSSAGLKMPIHIHCFRRALLTQKWVRLTQFWYAIRLH